MTRTVLLLLALIVVAAPASAAAGDSAGGDVAEARAAIAAGEPRAAMIHLKNALEAEPRNAEARFLLGTVYVGVGDGAGAEKELTRAQEYGYDAEAIALPLGRALLLQRKYQDLLDRVPAEGRDTKTVAELLLLRGGALSGLERWPEAEAAFTAAEALLPGDARPALGRARLAHARGDRAAAGRLVAEALSTDPKSIPALLAAAQLDRAAGDAEGAVARLETARRLAPDDLGVRVSLAGALIEANRDDEAMTLLAALAEEEGASPLADHLTAVVHAKRRDFAAARDTLQRSWSVLQYSVGSVFLSGAVHFGLGELERAETDLRRVLEAAPETPRARLLLGAILLRKDRAAEAVPLLRSVAAQAPEDPQVLGLYANALLKTGEFAEAAELFDKVADLGPASAASRTGLAISRLALGETGQAVEALSDAIDLDPQAEGPTILLVLTRLRQGNTDEALAALDKVEANLPKSPFVHNLRAAVHLARKDTAAADASLGAALEIDPQFGPAKLNLASLRLLQGRLDEAETQFLGVLGQDGGKVRALMGLADVALRRNQPADAVVWLDRAREAEPSDVGSRARLVVLLPRIGERERVVEVAQELEAIGDADPAALEAAGRAYMAAGDAASAIPPLRRLVEIAGTRPQSHALLAEALAATGDRHGAGDSLRAAIEAAPGFVPAYLRLAEIEEAAGRRDEADALVAALRQARPTGPAADALAGSLAASRGDFEAALRAFEASWQIRPTSEIAVQIFRVKTALGRGDEGVAGLAAWVDEHPEDRVAALALGGAHLRDGRLAEARTVFEALHARDPNDVVVLNELAWIYQRLGDDRALPFAERAHRQAPDNPLIADTLGWIAVQQGHLGRGLELLEKAHAAVPGHPEVRYHLAFALNAAGEPSKAATHLRILLRDHKGAPQEADARALYDAITAELDRGKTAN